MKRSVPAARSGRMFLAAAFLFLGVPAFCQLNADFEVRNHVLVKYRGREADVIVPETLGINRVGERAFAGNTLRSVKIPVGVDALDSGAFADCAFLETVFLPNTVTVIGYRAFFGCTFLETITIPRSLRSIGGGAFFNCRSLQTMNIPAGVRSIGDRAFSGCTGMQELSLSRRTKVGEHVFMGVPPGSIVYRN